ncbi:MAG: 4-hydroxy-tetrahydrodipicolinate reductase [Cyclobacteriaceae bacterium]|jgi:4-hydroxy-tetrahydrodipicolinate reductase|nr:4-hydroxy-tetrahydrodipicolinate reductase [Cyclobacteriaceae bacterium]
MKILLLGYGKMGKVIEQIALQRGHHIAGRITSANRHELPGINADVAIEFSKPEAAYENVKFCVENNLPVICGTTGWLERKAEIEKLTHHCNGTFFYASNFSIGVNIFFRLNEQLARIMNNFPDYAIQIDEVHHTQKKDAPSGTAISLAQGIMQHMPRKTSWVNHTDAATHEVPISSFRIDDVPGTHVVNYSSSIDDIEIKHIAHSREGFARGAVMVAEWIQGRKGVLTMEDFLQF